MTDEHSESSSDAFSDYEFEDDELEEAELLLKANLEAVKESEPDNSKPIATNGEATKPKIKRKKKNRKRPKKTRSNSDFHGDKKGSKKGSKKSAAATEDNQGDGKVQKTLSSGAKDSSSKKVALTDSTFKRSLSYTGSTGDNLRLSNRKQPASDSNTPTSSFQDSDAAVLGSTIGTEERTDKDQANSEANGNSQGSNMEETMGIKVVSSTNTSEGMLKTGSRLDLTHSEPKEASSPIKYELKFEGRVFLVSEKDRQMLEEQEKTLSEEGLRQLIINSNFPQKSPIKSLPAKPKVSSRELKEPNLEASKGPAVIEGTKKQAPESVNSKPKKRKKPILKSPNPISKKSKKNTQRKRNKTKSGTTSTKEKCSKTSLAAGSRKRESRTG